MPEITMTEAQLQNLLEAVRKGEEISLTSSSRQMSRWIRNEVEKRQMRVHVDAKAPEVPKSNAKANAALRSALGRRVE